MKTQDYQKQAADFLEMTGTTFICEFLKNDYHFKNDKDKRDIYRCTLKRGNREYKFNFGQSIARSGFYHKPEIPTAYDVLVSLTKYDPQSFEDFCAEYGYNEYSRMAERIYNSVVNEYKSLCCLYTDSEMEKLAEIQ